MWLGTVLTAPDKRRLLLPQLRTLGPGGSIEREMRISALLERGAFRSRRLSASAFLTHPTVQAFGASEASGEPALF